MVVSRLFSCHYHHSQANRRCKTIEFVFLGRHETLYPRLCYTMAAEKRISIGYRELWLVYQDIFILQSPKTECTRQIPLFMQYIYRK